MMVLVVFSLPLLILLLSKGKVSASDESLGTIRGIAKRDLEDNQIFGGTDVASGEFPFFVSLGSSVGSCGGTLLSPTRVLTAAHCFFDPTTKAYTPNDFTQIRINHIDATGGQLFDVQCVRIHPNYIAAPGVQLYNDVAILKLKSPGVTSGSFVTINSNTSHPGSAIPLTTIGFGKIDLNDVTTSTKLLKHTEPWITAAECNSGGQPAPQCINSIYHLCTSSAIGGPCQGDSGGPVFDANKVQVGIVSFGGACGTATPDVDVNVAQYYSWIQGELTSDLCDSTFSLPTTFSGPCPATPSPTTAPLTPAPTPAPTAAPAPKPTGGCRFVDQIAQAVTGFVDTVAKSFTP